MKRVENTHTIKYIGNYLFEVNENIFKYNLKNLYDYLEDFDEVLNDDKFKTSLRILKINKLQDNPTNELIGEVIYENNNMYYTQYSNYIADNLDNTIRYTEYVADNLDNTISYTEYIAESIGYYINNDNTYKSYSFNGYNSSIDTTD